jgi:hypothetical protein
VCKCDGVDDVCERTLSCGIVLSSCMSRRVWVVVKTLTRRVLKTFVLFEGCFGRFRTLLSLQLRCVVG